MKVCYLTPEHPPMRSGGIGAAIVARSRALVAAGHEVVVLALGPEQTVFDHGVQVRFAPVRHPPRLGWLVVPRALHRRVAEAVRTEGVDVVVAPDWIGIAAGVRPTCPLVVECHGSATYFGDELAEPVRRLVRRSERRAMRAADLVTSVGDHVATRTQALFGLAARPTVVPNGVDLGRFSEADPAGRADDLVLLAGTLVRKKGVLDAAAAVELAATARPGLHLRVVGPDAPDRSTGAASTWALVAPRLQGVDHEWTGPVPHDHLATELARASLLLAPSHAEAQPLVWLEAMAAGLPVVAYDLPWAREVVVHEQTGLLVPPGDVAGLADAVTRLLDDRPRRVAMGRAAAERVRQHFGIDQVAAQLGATLRAAVERGVAAPA